MNWEPAAWQPVDPPSAPRAQPVWPKAPAPAPTPAERRGLPWWGVPLIVLGLLLVFPILWFVVAFGFGVMGMAIGVLFFAIEFLVLLLAVAGLVWLIVHLAGRDAQAPGTPTSTPTPPPASHHLPGGGAWSNGPPAPAAMDEKEENP